MDPTAQPAQVCPDWVWLNNSNVHVARDRASFTTYTPFKSVLSPLYMGQEMPVLGIGSVTLKTKRSPDLTGRNNTGTLHLKEVLHCPDAFCNFLGGYLKDMDLDIVTHLTEKSGGYIKHKSGGKIAYFDPGKPLFALKLRGPASGPQPKSVLEPNCDYAFSCHWKDSERRKWNDFKAAQRLGRINGLSASEQSAPSSASSHARYTDAEKKFLKQHWGGEFKFLRDHGLSIYKDEDRDEGRDILKAFMEHDEASTTSFDPRAVPALESDEDEDSEHDYEGHLADHHFSIEALVWIDKYYGTSMHFMYCYGLKYYDDDDCEEAVAIVEAFMREDERVGRSV